MDGLALPAPSVPAFRTSAAEYHTDVASQRERLLSRQIPPPPAAEPVREAQTVTVICDRCRRPVAIMRRRTDRPADVTVTGYGRPGAAVRERQSGGWSLACRRHRDRRPFGPVGVSPQRARAVCDQLAGTKRPMVTMGALADRS